MATCRASSGGGTGWRRRSWSAARSLACSTFPIIPGDVALMLPYYVAVSAVYGGLTWAANSILPALVLHAGGDIAVLTRWWLTGRPEWQMGAVAQPLVWESGVDVPFVLAAFVALALAALTAWSFGFVRGIRLRSTVTAVTVASRSG